MPQKADRYSVLILDPRDLAERIAAARQLGLHWFAQDRGDRCALYLFFDETGRNNYLAGQYGSMVDNVREAIATIADGVPEAEILDRIRELVF